MGTSTDYQAIFNQLPIPVSFRCLEIGSDDVEYATKTISIFQNGFVMSSPRKLRVGGLLSLRLRLPREDSGSPFRESRCTGFVVSEHRLINGALAYRIEIETALPDLGPA